MRDRILLITAPVLLVLGIIGCQAVSPPSTPSPTTTPTAIPTKMTGPTATKTSAPLPSPTITSTLTDLETLDQSSQLYGESASDVIDFFLEIQESVRTDDKEKLASLVYYPISINSIDGQEVEIQNAEEFIANYDKIATPKWKSVVLAQEPAQLFSNWQGVMVNRGELWFTSICFETCEISKYYIIAIWNDTPW